MRARVLWLAAGVEARRSMAYRFDFWVDAAVVFVATVGLGWAVWSAIYATSGAARIGGLDLDAMVLYLVAVALVGKIVRGTELGPGSVSQDVYDGSLTRYLLQPVPYGPMKLAQHAGATFPSVVQLLLFGAPFLWLLRTPSAPVSPWSLLQGAVSVAMGLAVQFVLVFPVHCLAFKADAVWSLVVMVQFLARLAGGAIAPLSAFPEAWHPLLEALPFRHLYAEPAEALLGRRDLGAWAASLAWAAGWVVGLGAVGALAFQRGRRVYTGPGV